MPFSPENTPKKRLQKPLSLPNLCWFRDSKSLKHVLFNMQQLKQPLSPPYNRPDPPSPLGPTQPSDRISLLPDPILLRILSLLPSSQHNPNSLVSRRWLSLSGRLVRSLRLFDWTFLETGRLISRFPNLTDLDLVPACIDSPFNSSILLSHRHFSFHLEADLPDDFDDTVRYVSDTQFLPSDAIDDGLCVLARGCPNLRKLVLIAATESGISSVAAGCPMLQELELHRCTDLSLRSISGCQNLQILRLVGFVYGLYDSAVSDIGLTIVAHGCKRLVKLELNGCEGSYAGISAIGKCCLMLEELTLCDHRMDGGWIAGLSFCGNLKTLRLQACTRIDPAPGPPEHLGSCPTLERLQLQRCKLNDKCGANALFMVCGAVREIEFQDCWGLDNEIFGFASICRRVRLLSLEGCSLLTTVGLESVILSWKELQRLRVVSCTNIKDTEVTPALSSLFSVLKEFKWRPDSRSILASSLAGTGIRNKGGRFFKRALGLTG